MDITVSISEFRENIKQYLEDVANGKVVLLSKRGKVIARIASEDQSNKKEQLAYKRRIKDYKNGGIQIHQDIVNQPLKDLDYLDDSLFDDPSIAAEPGA